MVMIILLKTIHYPIDILFEQSWPLNLFEPFEYVIILSIYYLRILIFVVCLVLFGVRVRSSPVLLLDLQ